MAVRSVQTLVSLLRIEPTVPSTSLTAQRHYASRLECRRFELRGLTSVNRPANERLPHATPRHLNRNDIANRGPHKCAPVSAFSNASHSDLTIKRYRSLHSYPAIMNTHTKTPFKFEKLSFLNPNWS